MVGAYVAYVRPDGRWTRCSAAPASTSTSSSRCRSPSSSPRLMGAVLERVLIRRLYGRPLDTLLATWGVSLVLQQARAQHLRRAQRAGHRARPGCAAASRSRTTSSCPTARLFILGAGRPLHARRLPLPDEVRPRGRRMRAVMQNREIAGALGVATPRVDTLTFALGSGPGRRRRLRAGAARPDRPVARHLLHRRRLHGRRARRRRAARRRGRRGASRSAGSTRSSSTARRPRWRRCSSSSSSSPSCSGGRPGLVLRHAR